MNRKFVNRANARTGNGEASVTLCNYAVGTSMVGYLKWLMR